MYLYFDKKGVLKEIVNDEALRQGNYGINKIYAYIEDRVYDSVDVYYTLPSGLVVGPGNFDTFETAQIPFDQKRDLRFFKYFKDYEFVVIDLEADINGNGPLDQAGVVHCDLMALLDGGSMLTLGEVNFKVEENTTLNQKYVASEQYMSLSDYLFLRKYVDGHIGHIPLVNATTETLSPGSEAVVTVTSTVNDDNWMITFGFQVPEGATGPRGATGPQGAKGDTGEAGANGVITEGSGIIGFQVLNGVLYATTLDDDAEEKLSIDSDGQLVYNY